MIGAFDECLKLVLKSEGGFVNNPNDPGGMTNLGVTRNTWEAWVGRASSEKEMKSLTPELVAPLYKRKYWDAIRGDELPDGVDYCVFDMAVNSGVGRAVKFLQEIVGTTVDGAIGPKTLAATRAYDPVKLIEAYNEKRKAFLASLPTYQYFGKGWNHRIASVKAEALSMNA